MQISAHGVGRRVVAVVALGAAAALSACGNSPPSDQTAQAVRASVFDWRNDLYDAGETGAEVVAVNVTGWKKEPGSGREGMPAMYSGEWTAKLRLKAPLAFIVYALDGTNVVRIVAEKGEELPYTGNVNAMRAEGEWHIGASPDTDDMWDPIFERAGDVTFGYEVHSESGRQFAGRGVAFRPIEQFEPYVLEESDEHDALVAAANERRRIAQEGAAEQARQRQAALEEQRRQQQAAYEAEQQRRQAEYAEQQRRQQEEYAERIRLQQEAAAQRAEEQRRARLTPLVQPFANEHGVSISVENGARTLYVITDAAADTDAFTVTGTAVDVRQMPYRAVPFNGAVNDRAQLVLTIDNGEPAMVFGPYGANLAASGGMLLSTLDASARASLDGITDAGLRLGGATPTVLTPRILTAAEAKDAEATMQPAGMTGMVLWRNRVAVAVAPMFAGDLAVNRNYRWTAGENVTIRLNSPVTAPALYFRGTGGPSANLVIVINGVHRAVVDAIETMGAVVVPLPDDLEILEIRLDAVGTVQSRGVMLMQ